MTNRLDEWISKVKSDKTAAPAATQVQSQQQSSAPNPTTSPSNTPGNKKRRKPFFKKKSHPTPNQSGGNSSNKQRLRVIPLGGLNEVGRNCMALEYGNDIIIIDAGFQFPGEGMYGIDYVLPDTRYVEKKQQNIRAIIITHGHLDHIGGLRYLLPKLGYPTVYAPPLAVGLIEKQLNEFPQVRAKADIRRIDPNKDVLRFGAFTIEYFHVNHSIPDCNGLYIQTPAAKVLHTGDFKFDFTPADGIQSDYAKIADFGRRGVDAIFADSTNAQHPGFCISEKVVAETLENIIRSTKQGRLFITSFSSVLARWQQIIKFAQKYNRKVYVTGRSLLENLKIASDMGYINVPQGVIHKVSKRMHSTPAHQQMIISTGSQGEENAALSRIARGEHNLLKVEKNDTVVFSASPIPGNERQVIAVIDDLYKIGANVITRQKFDVHTSGHAHQGDLKLMYSLTKPKNIIPVHGEFHMRADHAKMVQEDLGFDEKNVGLIGNGEVLEIADGKLYHTREKAFGEHIFVDGNMVGDVGPQIQQERKAMMNNGTIAFTFHIDAKAKKLKQPPIAQSVGFAYPHESHNLHTQLRKEAMDVVNQAMSRHKDVKQGEKAIREELEKRLSEIVAKISEREPLVIATIVVD